MSDVKIGDPVVVQHPQINDGEPMEVKVCGRAGSQIKITSDALDEPRWVNSQAIYPIEESDGE